MGESHKNYIINCDSLVGVVQIVLIILKMCNLIDWSWWVVLFPLIICLAILMAISVFCTICVVFAKRKKARLENEEDD